MFLFLLLITGITLYYYSTKTFNYWAERNVKYEKPWPIFGTHFRNLFGYKSITEISMELYKKYPHEKVIGYYRGRVPELIIRDPDIVKQILISDFNYFYNRGLGRDSRMEPLMHRDLFHAEGDKWKLLRQSLTSTFTTSKLKSMFPLVVRCAEKLQTVAGELAARGAEYDVRELMARFTIESIGVCGFGINMDSINNENSQFQQLGKLIFQRDSMIAFKLALFEIFPVLKKVLRGSRKDIDECMLEIYEAVAKQRKYEPIGRNDFVDLILELRNNGKVIGHSIISQNPDGSPLQVELELDDITLAAQMMIFFAAGFDTSSHSTSYTLHLLAYNPDIQTKVQEDIDRVMVKYNNELCYDAIKEMSLLTMTFKESLRMFPPVGCLNRICAKKYTIQGLNISIDPGVRILIPVQALHNDKQYVVHPLEFRPERFLMDAEKEQQFLYVPFGEGPRKCIGFRLGQMQSLAGLAALLHKFTFEPSLSSVVYPEVNPLCNISQNLKNGLPLRLKIRKIL